MAGEQQGDLVSRLRAVIEAKDEQIAALTAGLEASRERERRLELRLAEMERRLGEDSTDSGTPSSKERIGAKQARRARRQESERERRKDRKRGGQPGHQGTGLARDPDPDENKDAEPPAECRRCRAGLDGAAAAGSRWAQVIDVEVIRKATEWALPGLQCRCCGTVTFAEPPPGAHRRPVSYGAVLNAAAVVLTGYGNVPPGRAAQVMAMLLGVPVSPGWAVKASGRLAAQLGKAGFDAAMLAALAGQDALAADETPVNVLGKDAPQPAAREEGRGRAGPGGEGEGGCGCPAGADRPDPGRAADLAAGPRLAAQGRCRCGDPGRVHRAADDRRLHRLPASSHPAGRHPAVLSALFRHCRYADDGRRSLLRG